MMSNMLPKACIDEIQRMQKSFIWGDSTDKKSYHVVSWDNVIRPKSEGRLGLRKMEQLNIACSMKSGWKFYNNSDDL